MAHLSFQSQVSWVPATVQQFLVERGVKMITRCFGVFNVIFAVKVSEHWHTWKDIAEYTLERNRMFVARVNGSSPMVETFSSIYELTPMKKCLNKARHCEWSVNYDWRIIFILFNSALVWTIFRISENTKHILTVQEYTCRFDNQLVFFATSDF